MSAEIDFADGPRYGIVHGLAMVTDEAGRLLLFADEATARVFADAIQAVSLDLVVVLPRTAEQIGHLLIMNGINPDDDTDSAVVVFDPGTDPDQMRRRAVEIATLVSESPGPTCADSFDNLEARLRGEAPESAG